MYIPTFQQIIILAQLAVLNVQLLSSFLLTFNFVLNAEIALKSESSCRLSSSPFTLKDWCLYAQRNTDYLATFILCVTSTRDKFPIPLHWVYIMVIQVLRLFPAFRGFI